MYCFLFVECSFVFFFKQKTAYEMRISDWSSDVYSSDLGDEQSGHIREVGFELYQSMLEEAILVAKAEGAGKLPPREALSPVITVDAPILIPEDYVPDLPLRMALYRRRAGGLLRPGGDRRAHV